MELAWEPVCRDGAAAATTGLVPVIVLPSAMSDGYVNLV